MRARTICLMLGGFLLCPLAAGQMQKHDNTEEQSIHNILHTSLHRARPTLSPQAQIDVIDTAIVRSYYFSDTTRHLYVYNAGGKRTSDLEQKLTGDLWVDTLLHTNAFDENNNMLLDLHEYWSNGQWMDDNRTTRSYDPNGKILTSLYEQWWSSQLIYSFHTTYTYDGSGNRLTALYENWAYGYRANPSRDTCTYDANGHKLTQLHQIMSGGYWVDSSRCTYTYDASGNTLTAFGEHWSTNKWVSSWSDTYVYDANNNMLSWVRQEAYLDLYLINYSRETCTYDAFRNKLSEMWEKWPGGEWVNVSLTTYVYDLYGHLLSQLSEDWSGDHWTNRTLDSYTYETDGNKTSWLQKSWIYGDWVNVWRDTCRYNGYGKLTSFWNYGWLNSSWNPMDIPGQPFAAYSLYDNAGNYFEFSGYNFTLVYKTISTGVASSNPGVPANFFLYQSYPNPCNPSSEIRYQISDFSDVSLTVYDLLGRKVTTLVNEVKRPGSYTVKFDGSGLASGVYFYRLEAGKYVQTERLILLK